MAVLLSGFTIVRNAVLLDFPVVESIRSILPLCDEVVVNVGRSDDQTLDLVRSIGDPRIRILETVWDFSRGEQLLAAETLRALRACRHRWGVCVQADEVLHESGVPLLARSLDEVDANFRVEGLVVRYRHFFGDPFSEAVNRRWYRREVRVLRLNPELDIHPFRDAQGFRVGPRHRKIRARLTEAEMYHYGWARSAAALRGRKTEDRKLYSAVHEPGAAEPLLQWFPGIRPFTGQHPAVARHWVERHRHDPDRTVSPPRFSWRHLRFYLSDAVERLTGARLFEFRNYRLV
ncbi:MAG TPA: glycosyltransferase [Gemmatimonadales bacterium]